MQRSLTLADEKALLASVSYDFSGLGIEGLSAIVNFVAGFDGKLLGARGNGQEIDLRSGRAGSPGTSGYGGKLPSRALRSQRPVVAAAA
jgi:hypothetical protein